MASQQQLNFVIKAINEASKELAKVQADLDAVGNSGLASNDKLSKLGGSLSTIGKVAGAAFAGAGVAAAGFAAASVNDFIKFERQMNEVFSLLPGISKEAMSEMSGQVKDFSKQFGVLPETVVPALYSALSAGVPQDNVFSFLETAQMAAKGGATQLETAVNGIAAVVNSYGSDVIDAATASDQMFLAVKLGQTTFEELSGSLANVTPVASAMGVSFGDVSAALAALTAKGTPTAQATTQLNMLFAELGKSGTKASDTFKEMSGKSFQDFIKAGGNVSDVLDVMQGAADKSGLSLIDMFGSIEAGKAALALSGNEFFTDAIGQMANSAGATKSAFDQMNQGIGPAIDKIKTFAKVTMLDLGEKLAPAVQKVADALVTGLPVALNTLKGIWQEVSGSLRTVWDENVSPIVESAQKLGDTIREKLEGPLSRVVAFFRENEKAMTAVGVAIGSVLVAGFVALGIAAAGAAVSVIAASLPIIAIAAAVAALGAGIYLLIENWDKITEKFPVLGELAAMVKEKFNEFTTFLTEKVWPDVQMVFNSLVAGAQMVGEFISKHWGTISEVLLPVFEQLEDVVERVFGFVMDIIGGAFNTVVGLFKVFKGLFTGDWDTFWEGIKQVFSGVWDLVTAAPKLAFGILWDVIQAGLLVVKELWEAAWGVISRKVSEVWEDVKSAVSSGISGVVTFFSELPGKITGALGDFGEMLYNAGKEIVSGLLRGLTDAIGGVWDEVSGWGGKIKGLKGPIEADRVLLLDEGAAIAEGLGTGLTEGFEEYVAPTLSAMGGRLQASVGEAVNRLHMAESFGSAGMRAYDALITAITDGTDKSLEALSSGAASLLEELRKKLPPEEAEAIGTQLMSALTIALETGGAEGITAVRNTLSEMNAAMERGTTKIVSLVDVFNTAIGKEFADRSLEEKVGSQGFRLMETLSKALADGSPKALGAVATMAVDLVEKLKESLDPRAAAGITTEFMAAIQTAIQTGGQAGLNSLQDILAKINGLTPSGSGSKGSGTSPGKVTIPTAPALSTQEEFDREMSFWRSKYETLTAQLRDAKNNLAYAISSGAPLSEIEAAQSLITELEKSKGYLDATKPVAEFRLGTDYVPRDGLAFLHKGEAVVPASQNRQQITVNVYASGYIRDTDELIRDIDRSLKRNGLSGISS